jgi:hypothetical protein
MFRTLFFGLLLACNAGVWAQETEFSTSRKDSAMGMPLLRVSYAVQVPLGGDLGARFGVAHNIGGSLGYKTRSNWMFTLGGHYIFGDHVNNSGTLLADLLTPDNIIIGNDGGPAIVNIGQAGYMIDLRVSKILPFLRANANSGPMLSLGTAFMEHWIVYDVENNSIPQLNGEYRKGYDRLTNGMVLNQFIGYHYQGDTRLLNFYGGFEFSQGFMGNRRSYDIPAKQKIDPSLTYFQFGFRIGWMLPFYKRDQNEYYYY